MEYDARSWRLSSLEPAHGGATHPKRSLAGQEGRPSRPDKKRMGVDLRDGGSSLASALPDRPGTKPCNGYDPETPAINASFESVASGYPSFAEIIERLDASPALSSVAKRDLKSAIKRIVVTWMGRDLAATPADIPWLRKQMADWTAARFGVSDGTFNTVRSQLNRALKVTRVREPRSRYRELGHAWQQIDEALEHYWVQRREADDKTPGDNWLRIRLRRFIGWCDERRIAPPQVNDRVIEHFCDDDAQTSLRGNPAERERGLRKAWNHAVKKVPGVAARNGRQHSQPSGQTDRHV
jgi:hypothetical protein